MQRMIGSRRTLSRVFLLTQAVFGLRYESFFYCLASCFTEAGELHGLQSDLPEEGWAEDRPFRR